MSLQGLQQNPQDTSNFYLANLYQATITDPNRSNISASLPTSPPPFSPPTYAVWVNSLWFLSLIISITCALLATLLQQWARRYLKVTQTRSSLHKRARIRSFFAEGVEQSYLTMVVEALPTLIHLSVSLFFAGLAVFLWNINLTIFALVLSWIGVCAALYGCITLIPMFRHSSPYYSPLTSVARPVVRALLYVFMILYFGFYALVDSFSSCWKRCSGLVRIFAHPLSWFMHLLRLTSMTPKEAILKSSSEIDTRAFTWTFDSLDEDHELDRFFSGLPGFHNSRVLKDPLRGLDYWQKLRPLEAAIRLLDRTLSSNVLPDQVRRQRADICTKAIDLMVTPGSFPNIVRQLGSEDQYGPAQSTEIVEFVRHWDNGKAEDTTLVQAMFSIVVARVQRHDDSWFKLASNELGIPETVLREHAGHGDNLSLAILIYITRKQFIHIRNPFWPSYSISDILAAASKFNVQDTSLELQHEFCALWNEMVQDAKKGTSDIPQYILGPIRNLYLALHRGTNSAPTRFSPATGDDDVILWDRDLYPVCNVSSHVHNDSASTALAPIVTHDDPPLFPASIAGPVTPSFPLPEPFHVDESLTTVPPYDNSYPTRQTIENLCVPVTSPDPASASVMPDSVLNEQESGEQKRVNITSTPQFGPEASTISYPPSASVPPVVTVLQSDVIPLTPSIPQTLLAPAPTSASALDNTLYTSMSLSYHDSSDHVLSRRLKTVTTSYPPSANRAMRTNIPTMLDPQAPPASITDSDGGIPSRSMRELDNGRTERPSSFTSPV